MDQYDSRIDCCWNWKCGQKKGFHISSKSKRDLKEFPTTGHSQNFMEFIKKELQPFVASKYQTSGQKTIIGQSLGGLLATEILLKQPDLFDNYIIVSPSLWWDDESLLKLTPKSFAKASPFTSPLEKKGK